MTTSATAVDFLVVISRRVHDDDTAETEASVSQQTDVTTEVLIADTGEAAVPAVLLAVNASRAEFVTFMDASDLLLEERALAKLQRGMADEQIEMLHAVPLHLDREGRLTRDAARSQSAENRKVYPDAAPGLALVTGERMVNPLVTFRRERLPTPDFKGESVADAVHNAATAVMDRGTMRVIASPLLVSRRRIKPAKAQDEQSEQNDLFRLSAYERASLYLRRWSLKGLRARRRSMGQKEHVAYALWRYPIVSDHVIRREVHTIRALGVRASVFAVEPDDPPLAEDEQSPAGETVYFGKVSRYECRQLLIHAALRRPLSVLRVLLLLVRHPPRNRKSWDADSDTLLDAARLAVMLRQNRVTHVHSPWANAPAFQALLAARLLGLTFSVEARASEIRRYYEAPALSDRLRFANFVITNSRYNEEFLRQFLVDARVPVTVIYEGIDPSSFTSAVQQPDGIARIVSVARLVEPKGFKHLLHACDRLRADGVAFHLDIVGGPESFDSATWVSLRKVYSELKLDGHVTFWGSQPFTVVKAAMERADVFVLPCVPGRDGSHDITPNSLFEAMAMSLPVISTRSGAIPEIVEHDVNGLLVPPGDELALANAMSTLSSDHSLRLRLGQAARATVVERFDIVRNAEAHARLFGALRPAQATHER